MNARFLCDHCGSQPCVCFEAECKRCNGEGKIEDAPPLAVQYAGPYIAKYVECGDCHGDGWIKCNRGGVDCPFERCYCEEAWERQQEDRASEPPPTAQERHERAYAERAALRGGYPL